MSKSVKIPLLRVYALPGGYLTTDYKEGARVPTSEEWWRAVLSDPRLNEPMRARFAADSPFAYLRLDRQHGETLEVENEDGILEPWTEVTDFGSSTPEDRHFMLDSLTGIVRSRRAAVKGFPRRRSRSRTA